MVGERPGEVGQPAVALVVALLLAGEGDVDRVVEVVAPTGVEPVAARLGGAHETGVVEVALGDDVRASAELARPFVEGRRRFLEEVACAHVEDRVNRVEAKRVDVEVGEPVDGVVGEEVAGYLKPDDNGKLVASSVRFGAKPDAAAKKKEPEKKK